MRVGVEVLGDGCFVNCPGGCSWGGGGELSFGGRMNAGCFVTRATRRCEFQRGRTAPNAAPSINAAYFASTDFHLGAAANGHSALDRAFTSQARRQVGGSSEEIAGVSMPPVQDQRDRTGSRVARIAR